jgi:catechol 2,3-dioxygenase-like lactoylglutathione lyase family enzyme
MVSRIDHIEIISRDADEYISYMETLGFEVITRTSHHGGSAELKLSGENQPIFEIHQVSGEENPGVNHIAFTVDDANAAYEHLQNNGVTSNPPNHVQSTGRLTVNLRDPDGWRMQLVDAERKAPDS